MKSKNPKKNRKNLCEVGKAEWVNAGVFHYHVFHYQEVRVDPLIICLTVTKGMF